MTQKKVLVTGAMGQIGSELTGELRRRYGSENVIATDIRKLEGKLAESGPCDILDVTDRAAVFALIHKYGVNTIYHMAAILSATGEKHPSLCWNVNMNGSINIMDAAVELDLGTVIIPSSIAVFGPETPRFDTPQETILKPKSMYGVTKVCGELLSNYYVKNLGVDIRGVRYPGIISSETPPGGGTTDYAVDIFYKAVEEGRYTCFVKEDTMLPMMYMPDCIKATIDLAEADKEKLIHCCEYNLSALSFTAGDLTAEIRKHIPDFEVTYEPDFRQAIADTWPASIDDSAAREEWGWKPDWDLENTTRDMLDKLQARG
ncbi:MAG: NAD-dependent epimerase/dehydratase family protein [Candidatus Sabulitectum sp.]|nr:NAD-dependent epimerase/dehydratase family protein [Candidatus Sabulitectum sp.]